MKTLLKILRPTLLLSTALTMGFATAAFAGVSRAPVLSPVPVFHLPVSPGGGNNGSQGGSGGFGLGSDQQSGWNGPDGPGAANPSYCAWVGGHCGLQPE